MTLKFKEKTRSRKRMPPKDGDFKRSKGKLLKKGKSKMTTQEQEPMHKQEELSGEGKVKSKKRSKKAAFPIFNEKTHKKNTKESKVNTKNTFSRSKNSEIEFKFGAGMVSGTVEGSKSGKGLHGQGPEVRSGKRSLGSQKDGDIADSTLESKGRKRSKKREEGKVKNSVRKVKSTKNTRTDNTSQKTVSGRSMTNKVTEVKSDFKRSKNYKK